MCRLFLLLLVPLAYKAQPGQLGEEWQHDKQLEGASISYCIMDADSGRIIEAYNEEQSLVPASTLKIFTTGAALGILGTDFRYTTRLCYSGRFDTVTGILYGDLVIAGSGDPTLQSEYFGTGDVCLQWAKILSEKGLREVRGAIIGNGAVWQRIIPDHWIWADVSNYFGTTPCGLSFKDNKFGLKFSSGAAGSAANVLSIDPQYRTKKISLSTEVICEGSQDKAYVYGDPFAFERRIRGSIPQNRKTFTIEAALPDPALLCAENLASALEEKGIRCGKRPASAYLPAARELTVAHEHHSPPLAQIVRQTNLHSNNHFCESLVLTLGKGNHEEGLSAIREYWRLRGLKTEGLFLADGSGLSRASTCNTKLQCVALEIILSDTSISETFYQSLPAAGSEGSMRSIGKGTNLENNMRAKTGYIQRVRSYCGYLKTKNGKNVVFSIIFNNYNCSPSQARDKMEKFMLSLTGL